MAPKRKLKDQKSDGDSGGRKPKRLSVGDGDSASGPDSRADEEVDLDLSDDNEGGNSGKRTTSRPKKESKKPKSKPKAKAKCSGRSAARSCGSKNIGGTKYCRGCGKWKPLDQFAINQDLDFECKSIKDRLYGMAKRQGQLDWFTATVHNDERFLVVMRAARMKLIVNKSRMRFDVAQYKECFESTTEVLVDDQGEMMTEDEWVEYATSKRTGRLTATQAQAQWQNWKDNKNSAEVYHDMDKDGNMRFRIHIRDLVTFRNSHIHKKQCEFIGKVFKKPTDENMHTLRDMILHGDVLETESERAQIAKNMVQAATGAETNGISSAFDGMNMHDIKKLAGSDSECEDDDGPEVAAKGEGIAKDKKEEKDRAKDKEKKDKEKFDESQLVDEQDKAARAWLKEVGKVQKMFVTCEPEADQVLEEAKANQDSKHIKNAYIICKRRTCAAKACMQMESTQLSMA